MEEIASSLEADYIEATLIVGENLGIGIDRDTARFANGKVTGNHSENTFINLGELGEHPARDVRFRDSAKQGFLTAYIRTREAVSEHKTVTTITASTIALGAVIAGIHHLKHSKQ